MTEAQLRYALECEHESTRSYHRNYAGVKSCSECGIEVTDDQARICGDFDKAAKVLINRQLRDIQSLREEANNL